MAAARDMLPGTAAASPRDAAEEEKAAAKAAAEAAAEEEAEEEEEEQQQQERAAPLRRLRALPGPSGSPAGGVRSRAMLAPSTPSELVIAGEVTVTEPMVARAAAEVAAQREVVALIEDTQHRALLNWSGDSLSALARLRAQFASYGEQLSAARRALERRAAIEETMRESLALDQLARDTRAAVAQRRQAALDAEQAFETTALEFHAAEASVQLGEAGLQRRLADSSMPPRATLALDG